MNGGGPSLWAVVTQVQTPTLQRLWEHLAGRFGRCLLVAGTAFPIAPGVPVTVRAAPAYDRRGVARRALSWARFLLAAAGALAAPGAPTRVVAVASPPLLPHVALLLNKLRGVRYALVVWDIYPEHVVEIGLLGARNPIVKAWSAMNRRALLCADVVITLSEGMAETIRQSLGRDAEKCRIEVIPSWANTDEVRPRDKAENPFAIRHGQTDKITVMYAGNVGATHDLMTLVDAAAELRDDPRIGFVFVGTGLGRKAVERRADDLGLGNVDFCDPVPWAEVPDMLATADIAVVAQAAESAHLSLPSKTYGALAAGSAILAITPAGSDLARLVTEMGAGDVCDPGDVAATVRAIRRFADDPARLRVARSRSRAAAETRFSAAAIHARYEDVLARTLFA